MREDGQVAWRSDAALRVLHVSAEDGHGGAFRAARRVHDSIRAQTDASGVDSLLLVGRRRDADPHVHTLNRTPNSTLVMQAASRLVAQEARVLSTQNPVLHSTARMPTRILRRIDDLNPNVVVLHWLGSRTASIAQIGRLLAGPRPVAWVLHDTWAFCGAEHYPSGNSDERFVTGYLPSNRPSWERGIDINRHTWERKRTHWTRPAQLIAPSTWMADEARRSALMADWPVEVIPNPLDVGWWAALPRAEARRRLNLSAAARVILFGAVGGESDPRKGADLLRAALPAVAGRLGDDTSRPLRILTFGGPPGTSAVNGIPVESVGRLDDKGLRLHYSAADVMVVPSRQEAFGQTASEATTAGTPVVAFDVGGLPDIVQDRMTGRLVEPFSVEGLAEAISWVVEDEQRNRELSDAAKRSAERWRSETVGSRYVALVQRLARRHV